MEKRKNVLISVCAAIFILQHVHAGRVAGPTPPSPPSSRAPKHFVLVHGQSQGAWAWYKLVPLLRSSGYNVTALDLAASGINLKHVLEIRSLSDYVQPIRDFMASLPPQEKVILVGHSFGGLVISQLMELFPEKIFLAIFLTALMPGPKFNVSTLCEEMARLSPNDQKDSEFTYDDQGTPLTVLFGPKFLESKVYNLSPVEDLAMATLLDRPFRVYCVPGFADDLILTKDKYESVRRVFIVAEKDAAIRKNFQEYMIRKNPPDGFKEIKGSDHMVMISKPFELFLLLKDFSHEEQSDSMIHTSSAKLPIFLSLSSFLPLLHY